MYFKRIELQGFKSFADPVTIDLNDGITCIVGPNGSGKSNISDALRWVLGEQSPKSLRGGKMDDVIFAGTATRKPKGMAEVSLVIDNSTGILPLEYSEVQVTRRMYRSGESEYLINGNQCRLKDIKELFMDTGIGVDGYSIIGQGKIQEIVSAKPESRREIFEEAAGVVLYKSRKADAERKLSAASDNLERVKDIIAEIEGRIDTLKDESEKASEYLVLRDRYKYLGVNIIIHNIDGLIRNVESSRQELNDIAEKLNNSVHDAALIEEKIESFRVDEAELSRDYEESNEKLLEKIEELNNITSIGQVNIEKIQGLERELERLSGVIKDTEAKLSVENNNFAGLENNEKEYRNDKKIAEEALVLAEHDFAETKNKLDAVNFEIEHSKDKIIELTNKNVSKRAEISTLESYTKTLNDRILQLNKESSGKDETDAENLRKLAEIEEKFNNKRGELEKETANINEIVIGIKSLNEKRESSVSRLQELNNEYNRTIARKNTIEEMESNYEGYNNAVRALMKRNFNGIIGTVSNLIEVPENFEVATETALGSAMQNIVCEDDNSAKAAVKWLKDSKAGRATFLPVASIKSKEISPDYEVKTASGYLGVASEIISINGKYRSVLEYLLGRVIFTKTMDDAVRISKISNRGFRIVTMDGEVINSGGAITGGKYRNKTANLLERKNEIEELKSKSNKIHKEIEKLNCELDDGERIVSELKTKRTLSYENLQNLEVELGVLRTERDHTKSLVKAASEYSTKHNDELKTISDDINRAKVMITKNKEEVQKSEEDIEKLKAVVEELLNEADRYGEKVNKLREDVLANKLEVNEQDARILGLNELIERVRDTITDLKIIKDDAEDKLEQLSERHAILTSSDVEANEKITLLKTAKLELEDRIKKTAATIEIIKTKSAECAQEHKKINAKIADLQDSKYKLEVKTAKNETLLDTQKDKLWDEFEVSFAEAQDIRDDQFVITAGNKESKEVKLRIAELGDVNISSIEEYKAVSKRYEFMTAQEKDLNTAMKELCSIINNMDKTIRDKFKENFDKVVINFEDSFKALFGGGHAELRLEDETDPLTSGIEIIAQPPGKRLKNLNLMSGGEKTLTAIALMFAVIKAKPTPFCILDEVEAALDEANIERFSNYLKHFDDVQFALITHHKATMEHADVLYGVTMPEQGISKVLSLKFEDGFSPEDFSED